MSSASIESVAPSLKALARERPGLALLIVHGSRARGEARVGSDWDFAYLATPETDIPAFHSELTLALGTDAVDLTNLATAGGLFRYRAARDGIVLFEREPHLFEKFWFNAVSFWCDAGPVLRVGYKSVLDGLGS